MDFSKINREGKKSFNDQKALIKKVLAGKEVKCLVCNQMLKFSNLEESDSASIGCAKGCTSIELDIC